MGGPEPRSHWLQTTASGGLAVDLSAVASLPRVPDIHGKVRVLSKTPLEYFTVCGRTLLFPLRVILLPPFIFTGRASSPGKPGGNAISRNNSSQH